MTQRCSSDIDDQLLHEFPGRLCHLLRAGLHGTTFGKAYRPSGHRRTGPGICRLSGSHRHNARLYFLVSSVLHDAHDTRAGQLCKHFLLVRAPLLNLICHTNQQFGGSEAIITALSDEYPIIGHHREIFVGGLFSVYFIVGLASCSQVCAFIMSTII